MRIDPMCLLVILTCCNAFAADDKPLPKPTIEFRLVADQAGDDTETFELDVSFGDRKQRQTLHLYKKSLLPDAPLASVAAKKEQDRDAILFKFKPEAAKVLEQITRQHQRKQIAILIDGRAISAATINEPIVNGEMVLSGSFTEKEISDLVEKLKAGINEEK